MAIKPCILADRRGIFAVFLMLSLDFGHIYQNLFGMVCARLMDDADMTAELTLFPIFAGHLSLFGHLLRQAAGNVARIWPLR